MWEVLLDNREGRLDRVLRSLTWAVWNDLLKKLAVPESKAAKATNLDQLLIMRCYLYNYTCNIPSGRLKSNLILDLYCILNLQR